MVFWGKIAGAVLGLYLGGGLGLLFGIIIGHFIDLSLEVSGFGSFFQSGQVMLVQQVFFTTTFSVMGCIAKADGRVSEQEISMAKLAMNRMQLDLRHRKRAVELFREGKLADFDVNFVLREFAKICGKQADLVRMFLEIQITIALADGSLQLEESRLLHQIAQSLHFPTAELKRLIQMVIAQQSAQAQSRATRTNAGIRDAYAILGISAHATQAELKKAYRLLMSQHHPDKLVARGLPKEMLKIATEKTQEIKLAYEQIKRYRANR